MLTLFVSFMLWDSRKMKKSENSRIPAECAQKQRQIEKHIQTVKSLQNQTLRVHQLYLITFNFICEVYVMGQ